MEDIRIYDFDFNLLCIEPNIISANWVLRHNAIGSFEAHFSPFSDIVRATLDKPYLVAVQGSKQAIVTAKQLGGDFVLYGRTVNWLLSKRISHGLDVEKLGIGGDLGSVITYLVTQAFSDADHFVMSPLPDIWGGEQMVSRRSTNLVSEVVAECLAKKKAGYGMVFDIENKQWRFFVRESRSTGLVVSELDKNAYSTELTEDVQDMATRGFYEREIADCGAWNAATNQPVLTQGSPLNYCKYYTVSESGTQFGITFNGGDRIVCRNTDGTWEKNGALDPVWTYIEKEIYNGDVCQTGMYRWEAMLDGETPEDAETNFAAHIFEKKITVKTRGLRYGIDYELGDIVKVQGIFGKPATFEKQINGVHIWYEQGDFGERPYMDQEDEI